MNANTASIAELAAAFDAAGVPNPEHWATEVDEYRPYSAENLEAKLHQELGKYNIADETLTKILSVLVV